MDYHYFRILKRPCSSLRINSFSIIRARGPEYDEVVPNEYESVRGLLELLGRTWTPDESIINF